MSAGIADDHEPEAEAGPVEKSEAARGEDDPDSEIRFRMNTVILWLETGRKLPSDCSPAVRLAWESTARAGCEAIERLFRGDV